jgi:ribosomal protein L11 methylase PrmA
MRTNPTDRHLPASFRDPAGFLFKRDQTLYRQVNLSYQGNYDLLMSSGLYQKLIKKKMIIPHTNVDTSPQLPDICYKIIQPEAIHFISYPYEWSFTQLKDAAMLTLAIQKMALSFGMSLKDATAYNIQFHNGSPVLIDTLSFEKYEVGKPWVAYRQFCQHFLAPLALMSKADIRFSQLLRVYIDGIPLDLCSKTLPWTSRLNFGLLTHIHLHASAQQRYSGKQVKSPQKGTSMSKMSMMGLIQNLENTVQNLTWKPAGTEWADYYQGTNYSDQAFETKKTVVSRLIHQVKPATLWDLGANNGVFSRLAADLPDCDVVSSDIDPAAVDINYQECKKQKTRSVLPLVIDLTNPSPAIGWSNEERASLLERGPVDMVLALALIHHIAISNNVPLEDVAEFMARAGQFLVIEFVPKEDSQVQILLTSREDIFPDYTLEGFIRAFSTQFTLQQQIPLEGTKRTIFLFERKG